MSIKTTIRKIIEKYFTIRGGESRITKETAMLRTTKSGMAVFSLKLLIQHGCYQIGQTDDLEFSFICIIRQKLHRLLYRI